ncbi:TPA: hypothetical protein ACHSNB_004935, partial [Escherichia coli]
MRMNLFEMEGFLRGKCVPRDLKVNETDAEYLVRKFDTLEAKEGANKRGNSSRLTQSFHFFMFEPIFSPVNA